MVRLRAQIDPARDGTRRGRGQRKGSSDDSRTIPPRAAFCACPHLRSIVAGPDTSAMTRRAPAGLSSGEASYREDRVEVPTPRRAREDRQGTQVGNPSADSSTERTAGRQAQRGKAGSVRGSAGTPIKQHQPLRNTERGNSQTRPDAPQRRALIPQRRQFCLSKGLDGSNEARGRASERYLCAK